MARGRACGDATVVVPATDDQSASRHAPHYPDVLRARAHGQHIVVTQRAHRVRRRRDRRIEPQPAMAAAALLPSLRARESLRTSTRSPGARIPILLRATGRLARCHSPLGRRHRARKLVSKSRAPTNALLRSGPGGTAAVPRKGRQTPVRGCQSTPGPRCYSSNRKKNPPAVQCRRAFAVLLENSQGANAYTRRPENPTHAARMTMIVRPSIVN